jgi:hypothetical protein
MEIERRNKREKKAITHFLVHDVIHSFSLETQDSYWRGIEAVRAPNLKLIDLGQGLENLAITSKTRPIDSEPVR